jgi:hypothetical protein
MKGGEILSMYKPLRRGLELAVAWSVPNYP